MGFSQRQAGEKFTRQVAQDFIGQLERTVDQRTGPGEQRAVAKTPKADPALRNFPTDQLATELRRPGFLVSEP